jgi:hypothetical protein
MGLLNHLFGGNKGLAEEMVVDSKKRIALWDEHLKNFAEREKLCRNFNYGTVDNAVTDFNSTKRVLGQIEATISSDIVNISKEKKTDQEILDDLTRLMSMGDIDSFTRSIVPAKDKESRLIELFKEILKVLKAELHLISLLKKKPSNVKELLLKLFDIISHHEFRLYKIFNSQMFSTDNLPMHKEIVSIAKAILLEEKIKKKIKKVIETDEEKFAREMLKHMEPGETPRRYRKLAEDIYSILAEMAGAPMRRSLDLTIGIRRLETLMKKDDTMFQIVKKLRPKYDDAKIKGVVLTFRSAYNLGHFIELEAEFAT